MIRAIICAAMLVAIQQGFSATNDLFAQSNQAYAAGDFHKAIDGYEQLVRDGQWHANLFYDLANAWYRAGDNGKAILNYERALALEPHHPEAEANLRVVREHARALELQPGPLERYLDIATTRTLSVTAAVTFWLIVFLAISLTLSRSRIRTGLLICSIVAFAASAFAAYFRENGARGRSLAVVTAKDVQARVATADTSASVLAVPAGSEVTVLSARGDWTYVSLPNEQRGWLPAKAVELVRL